MSSLQLQGDRQERKVQSPEALHFIRSKKQVVLISEAGVVVTHDW